MRIKDRLRNLNKNWPILPYERDDLGILRSIVHSISSKKSVSSDDSLLVGICREKIRRTKRDIKRRRIIAIADFFE